MRLAANAVASRGDARKIRRERVFAPRAPTNTAEQKRPETPCGLLRYASNMLGRMQSVDGRSSTALGSLTRVSDPAYPYRSIFGPVYPASKTALNAMTLAMAIELESTNIKVNAACPGFTKTNLNNYAGTQSVEEGAREPVRLALIGPDGPTGTFSNAAGPLPW